MSHTAQAEGPTNRIYNYVLGDFEEEKKKKEKEKWQQMLANVPIFKRKTKEFEAAADSVVEKTLNYKSEHLSSISCSEAY